MQNKAALAWEIFLSESLQRKWRKAEDRSSKFRMMEDASRQELAKYKFVGYATSDDDYGLFSKNIPKGTLWDWKKVYTK